MLETTKNAEMTFPVLYSKIAIYNDQFGLLGEGAGRLPIYQNVPLNIVNYGHKSQFCSRM